MNTKQIKAFESLDGWDEFYKEFTLKGSTSAENKRLLIEMAKRGEPRPNQRQCSLGVVLCNYIRKSGQSYDPDFDKLIRKLAPNWFEDKVAKNKQQLIEMAKKGESKPRCKHPLYVVFNSYICRVHTSYDPKFHRLIRKLAPHWFIDYSEIANQKKQQIIEMAKKGEPRPHTTKHHLGAVFNSYIRKKHDCYDPKFDKLIRKLAPHWFVDTAAENKRKLIKMAKSGEPKPRYKHLLGNALKSYVQKSSDCYDPEFDKLIRKLAPCWFEDRVAKNKRQLIQMAKKGKPKPHRKHPLGRKWLHYIAKSDNSYDPEFDKQIRKLAPHWFKAA